MPSSSSPQRIAVIGGGISGLAAAHELKIKGEPVLRHVTRRSHAMPQYHVGHKQRIAEINQRLDLHPTLALAGSSMYGVGVPGCIESGQKAARRVLDGLTHMDADSSRGGEMKFQTEQICTSPSLSTSNSIS